MSNGVDAYLRAISALAGWPHRPNLKRRNALLWAIHEHEVHQPLPCDLAIGLRIVANTLHWHAEKPYGETVQ